MPRGKCSESTWPNHYWSSRENSLNHNCIYLHITMWRCFQISVINLLPSSCKEAGHFIFVNWPYALTPRDVILEGKQWSTLCARSILRTRIVDFHAYPTRTQMSCLHLLVQGTSSVCFVISYALTHMICQSCDLINLIISFLLMAFRKEHW